MKRISQQMSPNKQRLAFRKNNFKSRESYLKVFIKILASLTPIACSSVLLL